MLDRSREDVRDRFDAAMRMPREAGEIVVGIVVAEVVEQQERVELFRIAKPERALEPHPRAFQGRLRVDQLLDWPYRHVPRLTQATQLPLRRVLHQHDDLAVRGPCQRRVQAVLGKETWNGNRRDAGSLVDLLAVERPLVVDEN